MYFQTSTVSLVLIIISISIKNFNLNILKCHKDFLIRFGLKTWVKVLQNLMNFENFWIASILVFVKLFIEH